MPWISYFMLDLSHPTQPSPSEGNRQRASVHGFLGGRNPSDIYLWWILWISICRMRRGANSPAALHACGANYPSQEREISPAARTTLHQGGSILPAARTTRTRH